MDTPGVNSIALMDKQTIETYDRYDLKKLEDT